MKKLSFLTLFFILLGIGFAVAVWLRIRSFDADTTATTVEVAAPAVNTAAPANPQIAGSESQLVELQQQQRGSATQASPASAREERYNQLLNTPPPAANTTALQVPDATSRITSAAPEPAKPPSLLQRVVKPIADALGIRNKQAPATPPEMQPSKGGSQPTADTTKTDPQQTSTADEDSDVTPPRLMAVEFTPPVVADGEQTVFGAVVTDDLSGVASVSGVIASPSGAQQGFACQREGETTRFSARIVIPKEAAEGIWTVKYLTLTDNARNTLTLNAAQGSLPPAATFRVTSSAPDSKGPTLKAIWLDAQSMSAGEKNQVYVQAEDDKSGVSLVSGVFVSPSKQARIGFACRNQSGTTWQCPVAPPTCVDCGAWQLEQVQMQDKANNMTTARGDNALVGAVRLQLFGDACDNTAPVITSLTVDPPVVSNAEASIVRVTAIATDNQCGVASLSGQAAPPSGGARLYFPFRPSGDGQTFVGEIAVPQHAVSGIWSIAWVQALDKGHNMRTYSSVDPALANVGFRVE